MFFPLVWDETFILKSTIIMLFILKMSVWETKIEIIRVKQNCIFFWLNKIIPNLIQENNKNKITKAYLILLKSITQAF